MLATTPQTRCTAMNTLPPSLLPRRPFGACSSKQEIALELSCRSTRAAVSARRCCLLRLAAAGAGTSLPPLPVQPGQPVVKVCGVTNAEDAEAAAAAGAHLIGMIFWPRAKRSVDGTVAAGIAAAARRHGAEPVGVFVDEDAATIERVCARAGVRIAQLHGDGARAALPSLPDGLAVVYVLHADKAGNVQTPLPPAGSRQPQWLIVDGLQGGSGEAFDWHQLRTQAAELTPHSSHGWLLAGGLTPDTVAEAVAIAGPTGVDVSSGVCGPDGLHKDLAKVQRYCSSALAAFEAAAATAVGGA